MRRSTKSNRSIANWKRQGRGAVGNSSIKPREVTVRRAADMRYVGQEHAVTVDLPMHLFEARYCRHQTLLR
jgi:N-methylhydantoinase A/oxoprolinase/acetone carboxylase beta subunit